MIKFHSLGDTHVCLIGKQFGTRERSVFRCGLSKYVLLTVRRAFRLLQGKEMREKKAPEPRRLYRRDTTRRDNKGKTLI